MTENKLQFNDDNMECLFKHSNTCTQSFNNTSLSVGHNVISFSTTVKKRGFYFRDDMRIDAHVKDTNRKAYIDKQHIRSINNLLPIDATKAQLSAFVLPKLEY